MKVYTALKLTCVNKKYLSFFFITNHTRVMIMEACNWRFPVMPTMEKYKAIKARVFFSYS